MTTASGKSIIMEMPSRTDTARIVPLTCTCGAELNVHIRGVPVTVTIEEWTATLTEADRDFFHREHEGKEVQIVSFRSRANTRPLP